MMYLEAHMLTVDHIQAAEQCRLGSTGLVMAKIPSYSPAWGVLYGCLLLLAGTGEAFVSRVPGRHVTHARVWRVRVASTPPFPSGLRNDTLPGVPSLSPEPLQGLKKAPGARNWPLLGNSLGMQRAGDMNRYLNKLVHRYGPLSSCHLMGYKMYNVASPELAKEVFQSRIRDMEERFIFPMVREVVGEQGMIFANGHEAALNRRLSFPAFHRADILDNALRVVIDTAKHMSRRYLAVPVGGVEPLHGVMKSLSLEIVAQACFSLPLGLLDDKSPYAGLDGLIKDSFRLMGQTMRFPLPFANKYGLNPHLRAFRQAWEDIAVIEDQIIQERRTQRAARRAQAAQGEEQEALMSRDLLDVYLEALELGEGDDDAISNASIRKNIHDIFLAGSDTTAGSMSAALFEITRNATILSTVLEELRHWDPNEPQHITVAGMQQRLPFLDRCVREALRLYPAAPQLLRAVSKDTQIGGYAVESGSVVVINIHAIHHNKDYWGDSVDDFRPERWSEGAGMSSRQDDGNGNQGKGGLSTYAYMPFGAGPRICLGLRFAMMEMLAVLAVLLKSVDMTPLHGDLPLQATYPSTINFKDNLPFVFNGPRI